jgi:glycosyltransferase involved in cell wall biosynthesis
MTMITMKAAYDRAQSGEKCRRDFLNGRSWDDWVDRVIIHTPHYLDFNGAESAGGRQRHIRDIAKVITEDWGRKVLIVQKALRTFETVCPAGFSVLGLKSDISSLGDPLHGWKTRHLAGKADAILYASAEDAWPFFAPESKGIQHGIWWDGPFSWWKRYINRLRNLQFLQNGRSVLCVDTNYINWVRGLGRKGLDLCTRCVYIPNYADTALLDPQQRDAPNYPLRILYARRFEFKRGPQLFLDALRVLKNRCIPFLARMYSIGGERQLRREIDQRDLVNEVHVCEETLDGIFAAYREADVAVVPTIWSEGTSLACVEAICAGIPVVTTPVGGLGNLVIPGFNGQIVAPIATELASAIEQFAVETVWRQTHKNCLAMREAFSFQRWRTRVAAWLKM